MRVDLRATVLSTRISHVALLRAEGVGISSSEIAEQSRRLLDIGKQERDRSGRKL